MKKRILKKTGMKKKILRRKNGKTRTLTSTFVLFLLH